jgi:aminoglycoside 6'-N-acetyltransferase I
MRVVDAGRDGGRRIPGNRWLVRPVEPRDAAQWIQLRDALWPEEGDSTHAAEVARFLEHPGPGLGAMPEAVFVAVDAKHPTVLRGFAEVSRRAYAEGCETSPVGFLEGWYVVPEYRRQGMGRALVRMAEGWARGKGCREFASDALADNQISAQAHRALDFEEVEVIRCFRKELEAGS